MIVSCLQLEKLNIRASKIEVKNLIYKLVDEDFNGDNGDEFYTEVVTMDKTTSVSKLDAWMLFYDKYIDNSSIKEFIEEVLKDFSKNLYDSKVLYKIEEMGQNIVVAVSQHWEE